MKLYVVRSLIVAWMTVTVYVSLALWSRSGIDQFDLDIVGARQQRQPHAPHDTLPAAADPVLAHRRVVAEVKAKHLQLSNRTGWERYFQYRAIGDRVWPTASNERDDRILNQLHLTHQDPAGSRLKKILLANGLEADMHPGQERFIAHGCPVNQCLLTAKPEDAASADLILFNGRVWRPAFPRPPHQIWALFMLESPYHTPSLADFDGQVNWTATYRLDSTLVAPYERFTYFTNYSGVLPDRAPRDVKAAKTRHVAWFASNCGAPNGRKNYVDELQKYIDVDVYGSCGPLHCPRHSSKDRCNKKLRDEYHFYLSFENSNCRDYITEKLFWNALLNDVVPVVMGAPRSDYERAAPPQSFIHVDDFASPRQLADFLRAVAADRDRYNSYFRWQGSGEYIDTKFWCRLCALLHESRRTGRHSVYERLDDWWRVRGTCIEDKAPGKAWMSWRDQYIPDILNATYHRQWTDNAPASVQSASLRLPASPTI